MDFISFLGSFYLFIREDLYCGQGFIVGIFIYLLCDFAVVWIFLIFCVDFNFLLGRLYLPHVKNCLRNSGFMLRPE